MDETYAPSDYFGAKKVALSIKDMLYIMKLMWGLGTRFVRFGDYFSGRRYHRQKRGECVVCGEKFGTLETMEKHRRDSHPNVPPPEASA